MIINAPYLRSPEDVIIHDLKQVKISWPLSCYGLNLSWADGNNIVNGDFSPEELRCEAYFQIRSLGNIEEYKKTLQRALDEKRRVIDDIAAHPAKGVALGRAPRNSAMQDLMGSVRNENGAARPVDNSIPQASLPTHQSNMQLLADYDFGDIPELPPS